MVPRLKRPPPHLSPLLPPVQATCEQLAGALAEVDEAGMRAKVQRASQERDEAHAECNRWGLVLVGGWLGGKVDATCQQQAPSRQHVGQ